ncbi:MAG: hypothetical protein LBJ18_03620 [Rickettsiales bacterium]|jgi:hypothetical protein|nr:hypothetical protein [Rickettsiales bacterium]
MTDLKEVQDKVKHSILEQVGAENMDDAEAALQKQQLAIELAADIPVDDPDDEKDPDEADPKPTSADPNKPDDSPKPTPADDDKTLPAPDLTEEESLALAPFKKEIKDKLVSIPEDIRAEIVRVNSVSQKYIERLENDKKAYQESIQPVYGYLSSVAKSSQIPINEVVRNCVNWIQSLEVSPEQTILNALLAGNIRLNSPETILRGIERIYNIKTTRTEQEEQMALANDRAFLAEQNLQASRNFQSHMRDAEIATAENELISTIGAFKDAHNGFDVSSPLFQYFVIQEEKKADGRDALNIMESAFAAMNAAYPQTPPANPIPPKVVDVNKKLAKVAPKNNGVSGADTPVKAESLEEVRKNLNKSFSALI